MKPWSVSYPSLIKLLLNLGDLSEMFNFPPFLFFFPYEKPLCLPDSGGLFDANSKELSPTALL
jgi:hypothetical protein